MLSEQGRRCTQLPRRRAELPRGTGVFQLARLRVGDRGEEAAHAQVVTAQQIAHRREGGEGELALEATGIDLLNRVL